LKISNKSSFFVMRMIYSTTEGKTRAAAIFV